MTLRGRDATDLKNFYDKQNKDKNTFLHIYAQSNDLKLLFSQDVELNQNLAETLVKINYEGKTFLATAIDNINLESTERQEVDNAMCDVIDKIAKAYGDDTVSTMCRSTDTNGNNLLRLASQKSLRSLVSYLLPLTIDDMNKLNTDGHNPLHVAVYRNDVELIQTILNTEVKNVVDVNGRTFYGETALHIAAKQGYLNIIEELIRHGGDLSRQDNDRHSPLHDCLQQVYFESGYEEEGKCDKFIKVWNKVVEEAVTWWCKKHDVFHPISNTVQYNPCQIKAVYYLRSCIKNKNGLSVLQYAADRGLVSCVQAMLATKAVFAIQDEENMDNDNGLKFKIDITNLSPEYGVPLTDLYENPELTNLDALPKGKSDSPKKPPTSSARNKSCPVNSGCNDENEPLKQEPEPDSAKKPPTSSTRNKSCPVNSGCNDENEPLKQEPEPDSAKKPPTSSTRNKSCPVNSGGKDENEPLKQEPEVESGASNQTAEYNTLIDALANVKPSNKAGEILELTPLITLTKLQ